MIKWSIVFSICCACANQQGVPKYNYTEVSEAVVARIDSVLKVAFDSNVSIKKVYLINEGFLMNNKRTSELIGELRLIKDSVLNLCEPYYQTIDKRSLEYFNFVFYFQQFRNYLSKDSMIETIRYNSCLGAMAANIEFSRKSPTEQEKFILSRLRWFGRRINQSGIDGVIRVCGFSLKTPKQHYFVDVNLNGKQMIFVFDEDLNFQKTDFLSSH